MKADFKKETCSKPQINLKTVLEDAFDKLKGFTEKISQDNSKNITIYQRTRKQIMKRLE